MKYSVLMSVYKNDSHDYLKAALESVYEKQIRKPDEIIVVFDGPLSDNLYSVLANFRIGKEEVVKYYQKEKNEGLGEALRIGSDMCNGDYIFRMDADDISDEHRFERQIAVIEAHPEIDVLGTDIVEFYNDPLEKCKRVRSCPSRHDQIVTMSKRRNPMNHVSVCIKKSALVMCGGYKHLLLLEDYYLWIRMISCGCQLANINEPLVFVRIGNDFEIKRSSRDRIVGWKVLQDYMVEKRMISKFTAFTNMIAINLFVRTNPNIKTIIYKSVLRKNN